MAIILIGDDQLRVRKQVSIELAAEGYDVTTVGDDKAVFKNIRKLQPSMVLLNALSDNFDSFNLLLDIKRYNPKLPVLVYVIKSFDAIISLKDAIDGVLHKNVWVKYINKPAPSTTTHCQ